MGQLSVIWPKGERLRVKRSACCGWWDLVQSYLNKIEYKAIWNEMGVECYWINQPVALSNLRIRLNKNNMPPSRVSPNQYDPGHIHIILHQITETLRGQAFLTSTSSSSCFVVRVQDNDTAPGGAFLLSAFNKHWEQTKLQQTKHLLWFFLLLSHDIRFIIYLALTFPSARRSALWFKTSSLCKAVRFQWAHANWTLSLSAVSLGVTAQSVNYHYSAVRFVWNLNPCFLYWSKMKLTKTGGGGSRTSPPPESAGGESWKIGNLGCDMSANPSWEEVHQWRWGKGGARLTWGAISEWQDDLSIRFLAPILTC